MPAHQCPRCELRFSYRTEVEAHLATDHRPKPAEKAVATTRAPVERRTMAKAPAPS